jgi:hypothetical protein
MVRITPIDEDWVDKGYHIHVHSIELAVHPDHLGGIVFRKVFSSTSDDDFDVATRVATAMLQGCGLVPKAPRYTRKGDGLPARRDGSKAAEGPREAVRVQLPQDRPR